MAALPPDAEIPQEVIDDMESVKTETGRIASEFGRMAEPPGWYEWIIGRKGERRVLVNRIQYGVASAYWLVVFVIGPWPLTVSNVGFVLATVTLPRIARRTGRVALSEVWPLVVAVLMFAVLGAGLDGNLVGAEPGTYHFAADAHLTDGRYVRLGEASDRTLLLSCGQAHGQVLAVDNSEVVSIELEPWKSDPLGWPTLLGTLTGHGRSYGFQSRC